MSWKAQIEEFVEQQKRTASGVRLERLNRDLTAEKVMLEVAILPVLKTFDGLSLEHEIRSITGVNLYLDVFLIPREFIFESDGFVSHAQDITRERFMFERMRIRTFTQYGYKFCPFAWDELKKRPDLCRRNVYELLGRYGDTYHKAYKELTVYEREVLRYAFRLNRPIRSEDVCYCLGKSPLTCRSILRGLVDKGLLAPAGTGSVRIHAYVLTQKAYAFLV